MLGYDWAYQVFNVTISKRAITVKSVWHSPSPRVRAEDAVTEIWSVEKAMKPDEVVICVSIFNCLSITGLCLLFKFKLVSVPLKTSFLRGLLPPPLSSRQDWPSRWSADDWVRTQAPSAGEGGRRKAGTVTNYWGMWGVARVTLHWAEILFGV